MCVSVDGVDVNKNCFSLHVLEALAAIIFYVYMLVSACVYVRLFILLNDFLFAPLHSTLFCFFCVCEDLCACSTISVVSLILIFKYRKV